MFYFDESRSVGKAKCVKNVALLKNTTKEELESYKMSRKGCNGRRGVGGCWWKSGLLIILEVLDQLLGDATTVFCVSDSCLEQFNVETGVSKNFDDIFHLSSGGCCFKDVDGNCKESELSSGSTSVPSRCGGEQKR